MKKLLDSSFVGWAAILSGVVDLRRSDRVRTVSPAGLQ